MSTITKLNQQEDDLEDEYKLELFDEVILRYLLHINNLDDFKKKYSLKFDSDSEKSLNFI